MEVHNKLKTRAMEHFSVSKKVRELLHSVWSKFSPGGKSETAKVDQKATVEEDHRRLIRRSSDSNIEKIEDLVSDGLCVAGDLDTYDTTIEVIPAKWVC